MKALSSIFLVALIAGLSYLAYPQIGYLLAKGGDDNVVSTSLEAGMSDEQWEFLQDEAELVAYAAEMGYKLTAGEMYRTLYQQRENVRKGVSWTYNSKHLKRLAVDFNLLVDGHLAQHLDDYRELGVYWESLSENNRWGGRFKDAPHFERMLKPRSSSMHPL